MGGFFYISVRCKFTAWFRSQTETRTGGDFVRLLFLVRCAIFTVPTSRYRGVLFVKKSYILPFSCFAFLVAITALSLNLVWIIWSLVIGLLLLFVFGGKVFRKMFFFSLLLIGAAVFRFDQVETRATSYRQYVSSDTIEFAAYVKSQETRSATRQRLTVEVRGFEQAELVGQTILVNTGRFPVVQKGQIVKVECLLERPEPFEGFAYDKYLASQSIFLLCQNAEVEIVGEEISLPKHPLEYGRIAIADTIGNLWARPVSSLVAGLLLGTRESFPEQTLLDFRRAGVTHIIALSGFNITILIVFLETLMVRLLIPPKVRLYSIFGGIFLFTIFVGAGASITRAAIMGSLAILSKNVARNVSPLRIMVITAAVMTIFQPYILMFDVGFQLSFVSTIGLIYLTPFIEKLLKWVPNIFGVKESLTTTLAAITATLPLILYQFEQLSIVSPVANVLILPLIPWLMLLGFLSVLSSWIIPFVTPVLAWLADVGCQYVLNVSKLAASWKFSAMPVSLPVWGMVGGYVLLGWVMIRWREQTG